MWTSPVERSRLVGDRAIDEPVSHHRIERSKRHQDRSSIQVLRVDVRRRLKDGCRGMVQERAEASRSDLAVKDADVRIVAPHPQPAIPALPRNNVDAIRFFLAVELEAVAHLVAGHREGFGDDVAAVDEQSWVSRTVRAPDTSGWRATLLDGFVVPSRRSGTC